MKRIFNIICIMIIITSVFSVTLSAKTLDYPLVIQEQSQWCWAAVSRSALLYYGINIPQCEIAEYTRVHATWHDFGAVNCCINATAGCNYWNYNWGADGSIEDILNNWGFQLRNFGRYLSESEIDSQIASNNPFIIRWGWLTGGGHFVVGYGLNNSFVNYMDPWFGEGHKTARYSWVVSGANHAWTHTQTIQNGSLQVNIEPAGARTAGAQWRRTGTTTWYNSGATESNVPTGTHTVEFKTVPGWKPIARITVNVQANTTTTSTGTYIEHTGTSLPGVLMLLLDEEE